MFVCVSNCASFVYHLRSRVSVSDQDRLFVLAEIHTVDPIIGLIFHLHYRTCERRRQDLRRFNGKFMQACTFVHLPVYVCVRVPLSPWVLTFFLSQCGRPLSVADRILPFTLSSCCQSQHIVTWSPPESPPLVCLRQEKVHRCFRVAARTIKAVPLPV